MKSMGECSLGGSNRERWKLVRYFKVKVRYCKVKVRYCKVKVR